MNYFLELLKPFQDKLCDPIPSSMQLSHEARPQLFFALHDQKKRTGVRIFRIEVKSRQEL